MFFNIEFFCNDIRTYYVLYTGLPPLLVSVIDARVWNGLEAFLVVFSGISEDSRLFETCWSLT
jgi:hypothetical protein